MYIPDWYELRDSELIDRYIELRDSGLITSEELYKLCDYLDSLAREEDRESRAEVQSRIKVLRSEARVLYAKLPTLSGPALLEAKSIASSKWAESKSLEAYLASSKSASEPTFQRTQQVKVSPAINQKSLNYLLSSPVESFRYYSNRYWRTNFIRSGYYGLLFSRLYIGSWHMPKIQQNFKYTYAQGSLAQLMHK